MVFKFSQRKSTMKTLIEIFQTFKFLFSKIYLRDYQQAKIHRELIFRDQCYISPSAYFSGPSKRIKIGERSAIGDYANIRFKKGYISIGSDVLMAQFVTIIASEHQYKNKEIPIIRQPVDELAVTIGDDVWIGAYSLIRANVKIGKGAVIAAHSVVSCDIPAYEVWGGVPAKKISERV